MIYLNNAATSYPKPACVLRAHAEALAHPPAAQFRGGSAAADFYGDCQKTMGRILGIAETERIFFTSGATHSVNAVLSGLDLAGKHIVTTAAEHNSVLRPLYNLPQLKDCSVAVVPCDRFGKVDPADMEKAMTNRTALVMVNHCSNVTGMVQDMEAIGKIAKKHGAWFLADVSQSAGCMPVCADRWQADIIIFTGHKSLFGVQGTGGYYVSAKLTLRPFLYGGTGRDSSRLIYENPSAYEYDAGTQNAPGLAALRAGAAYILEKGVETVAEQEQRLTAFLYDGLEALPGIIVYGQKGYNTGPVVSLNVRGLSPSDTAYILQNGYDITVRTGLHCAPLIHRFLGSDPLGTVRVSLSCLNTRREIVYLLEALREITQNAVMLRKR